MASTAEISQFHQPRTYQLEMFRESLKGNIIVAMDTGSGKTTIAILRIQEAFKDPEAAGRLAWFLCPSVALARQQHQVVTKQLPALSSCLIIGEDGVDHWSTQDIWDAVLHNRSIVVSTYQVLHDSLQHGFVKMERLVLLVVDEAHHCFGKSALNKIMQNFYHPSKETGSQVPHILGLTASPVLRNDVKEMDKIEQNLDAVCRSPRISREDLLRHVHRPDMVYISYERSQADILGGDHWTNRLEAVYAAIDMAEEPWVKRLKSERPDDLEALRKAVVQRKTYTCEQMRSFKSNTEELARELGPWASRHYLTLCYQEILLQIEQPGGDPFRVSELKFLAKLFRDIDVPLQVEDLPPSDHEISPKALKLIELLPDELLGTSAGIVFAKTRATVSLLAKLLASSRNKQSFRLGTFVGQSGFQGRTNSIGETLSKSSQMSSLDDLRAGYKNLIVSTNACEEGIDISVCNFVICYDNPPNLKSFVQRRGRARARNSKYIIMHDEYSPAMKNDWIKLEEEMRERYTNHLRELQRLQDLESSEEGHRELKIESTQARIDLDDAVSHLAHFCQKLPVAAFTDSRPLYSFLESLGENKICTVTLPVSMDVSLRTFTSSRAWKTEQLAKKDAAFEAYLALHIAGLVNENLLPEPVLDEAIKEILKRVDKRDQIVQIESQLDPMAMLAQEWECTNLMHLYVIHINDTSGDGLCDSIRVKERMLLALPMKLPSLQSFNIYWDRETTWSVRLVFHHSVKTQDLLDLANSATDILLRSAFESRMGHCAVGETYPVLFFPEGEQDSLDQWIQRVGQKTPAPELLSGWQPEDHAGQFVIRRTNQQGGALKYCAVEDHLVEVAPDYKTKEVRPCFRAYRISRRTDFMHPIPDEQEPPRSNETFVQIDACTIQPLSLSAATFALLIPSIMRQIGRSLLAQQFKSSNEFPFEEADLLLEALTVSSAREAKDYQRLEFLGDAVLGYYTSLRLMMQNSKWHEGYLTQAKSHAVCNAYLHKTFMELDLARYVVTEPFTGAKWTPPTNRKLRERNEQGTSLRAVSTKTTADVIEALLGAAASHSESEASVLGMLRFCVSYVEWLPIAQYAEKLQSFVDKTIPLPQHFTTLEQLLGHHFKWPALVVEALTHPSDVFSSSTTSYQRLEFLGDSILEVLVTKYIFFKSNLDENRMHLMRTAAVNNNFLAFLALKHEVFVEQKVLKRKHVDSPDVCTPRKTAGIAFESVDTQERRTLHQFMMQAPSYVMVEAMSATVARFQRLEPEITRALETGRSYPWALFSTLGPEKFFGDLVESVIGALFIDSGGSEEVCVEYLGRLGMWAFLDRAIGTGMHIMQPKQELGIMANREKIRYDTQAEGDGFVSSVSIGDRLVATASGRQRAEAETLAAAKAIAVMKETDVEIEM